jgi:DNA-binding CsgD family transcriptional regulator
VAYCYQALSFLIDPEPGRQRTVESIAIFQSCGDEWGETLAVHTLGLLESQRGDPEEGRANLEEGLRRYQRLGDAFMMVQVLNLLGDLDRNEDRYELARVHYEAALAVEQASIHQPIKPSLIQNLGFVALHLNEQAEALERFRQALKVFSERGDRRGVAESLTGVAAVLAREGELEQAAITLGAARGILVEAHAMLWRSNREDVGMTEGELRERLGETRLAALMEEGEALPLREAVDQAMGKAPTFQRPRRHGPGSPLSPREREVAILVARGYRNRQIAEALVISEGTARLHVKHILQRLGFSSRAEIAAWAAAQGLLNAEPQ